MELGLAYAALGGADLDRFDSMKAAVQLRAWAAQMKADKGKYAGDYENAAKGLLEYAEALEDMWD